MIGNPLFDKLQSLCEIAYVNNRTFEDGFYYINVEDVPTDALGVIAAAAFKFDTYDNYDTFALNTVGHAFEIFLRCDKPANALNFASLARFKTMERYKTCIQECMQQFCDNDNNDLGRRHA